MKLPNFVQIEPVGQCNLRCQMCPIQFRQDGPPYGPPAFMPFETFTRLIDQFPHIKQLHLQGLGEPMMHPRFFEMVQYAAARGIRVTTNTNLTLLNTRRAAECVASGLETIYVSIDGATAETYERIRVRAHHDRVMNNLQLLLQAREGHALPHLWIVMVIMRNNFSELPALVRLAKDWQAEGLSVQHLAHDFQESSLPAHYRADAGFRAGRDTVGGRSTAGGLLLQRGPRDRRGVAVGTAPAQHAAAGSSTRDAGTRSVQLAVDGRVHQLSRDWRCRAAWSPLPIGPISAIWPSGAWRRCGIAASLRVSVSGWRRIVRRRSASRVRCTGGRFALLQGVILSREAAKKLPAKTSRFAVFAGSDWLCYR